MVISLMELERCGIWVNAICLAVKTRLTLKSTPTGAVMAKKPPEGVFDPLDLANVASVVAYLASDKAEGINGTVFHVMGRCIIDGEMAQYWKEHIKRGKIESQRVSC